MKKNISIKQLKKICKFYSFDQLGTTEQYNTKKTQENIKVTDLFQAIKKGKQV